MNQNEIDDPASPYGPYRRRGRQRQRWDDYIADVCKVYLDANCDWISAMGCYDGNIREIEDEFIIHAHGFFYCIYFSLVFVCISL